MNIYLHYNLDKVCRVVLQEQLDKFAVKYSLSDTGCVHFHENLPDVTYVNIHKALNSYGIEIIDDKKGILVQKVKASIGRMLDQCNMPLVKISAHLADELGENYRTIAQIFTEVCHVTIENFIILYKIERVKQMLAINDASLTEISYKMNYSSVAHLSNQFKKITGLTPSTFQKLTRSKRAFKAAMSN